eukprot:INCI4772.2.p1 GENE.INCI4772.2~~INCI4772.2.p1  ORF type:complete len:570 (-),score=90.15 INCI4772.2:1486-3195(-)
MDCPAAEDTAGYQQLVVRSRYAVSTSETPALAANSVPSQVLHTPSLKHLFHGLLQLPICPPHLGDDTVGSPTKAGALSLENGSNTGGVDGRVVLHGSLDQSTPLLKNDSPHSRATSEKLRSVPQRVTPTESNHVVVEDIDEVDITSSSSYVDGNNYVHSDSTSENTASNASLIVAQQDFNDDRLIAVERESCTLQRSNAGAEISECKNDPGSVEESDERFLEFLSVVENVKKTECSGFSLDGGIASGRWSGNSASSHALLENSDEAELPSYAPLTTEVVAMEGIDTTDLECRPKVSPRGADHAAQKCQHQRGRFRSDQAQKVLSLRLDVDTRVYSPTQASRGRIRPGGHIGKLNTAAATASLDSMVVQARVRVGHPLLLRLYDVPQICSVWDHAAHDDNQADSSDASHLPSEGGTRMFQEKSSSIVLEKPTKVAIAPKRDNSTFARASSHLLQQSTFPRGSNSGKLATPSSDNIAAVTGPKSLFRRKNVLTIDLCDTELRTGLVQFFELYNGIPLATASEAEFPILLIFVDLSLGKVEEQRRLVIQLGGILSELKKNHPSHAVYVCLAM